MFSIQSYVHLVNSFLREIEGKLKNHKIYTSYNKLYIVFMNAVLVACHSREQ